MSAYESSGRTVQEAITAGLEKLNLSIGEVQVDILDEGSKGLFGLFGSKLARVRLTIKESDEADSANVFAGSLDSYDASQAATAAKAREAAEKPQRPQSQPQHKPQADKPAAAVRPAPRIMMDEEEATARAARAPRAPRPPRPKAAAPVAPAAAAATAQTAAPKAPRASTAPSAPAVPAAAVAPAVQLDPATLEGSVQRFLQELTALMGVNVSVSALTDEEGNIRVNMEGDTLGILIGRRGETLDALQYLTALYLNKGKDTYTRVTLDSEGYRAKREDALIRLANRMASRAVKTGRRVTMEPMNPYERRILHSALQNHPGIATHSEGEEPNRHVVITLAKEGEDAAAENQS